MEFRILGPLEVYDEGRLIPVTRPKQRALLALLLLHANEVVTTGRLLELVWGDAPPETASTGLRVNVSSLRKLLGRDVIETRPHGYVLRLAPEQLDLARFERLVAQARGLPVRERADRLREALSLWRGEPLADLVYEGFLQAEIAPLGELWLGALEERVEADLAAGRAPELVGELEGLVARFPLRERLAGQLMLALYRSGRQADALEVYRQFRLALDPNPELKELERQILGHDPVLEPAGTRGREEAAPGPMREERALVTVLVCELSLAASGPVDPEDARARLAAASTAVRREFDRFGGTVESLIGDTVLAVFGAPVAQEDDSVRALRAALAARAAVATLNASQPQLPLQVRSAVATGEALVTLGDRRHRQPLISGEPVNVAVRLQHAAPAGGILVDAPTYRSTEHVIELRRAEPLAIGASEPASAWEPVEPTPGLVQTD